MPFEDLRILLVEDNPGDAGLIRHALKDAYESRFELVHYTSLTEALEYLSQAHPDVIVVDLGLPDVCGIDVVKLTRAGAPATPVVVLTGQSDQALGLQALQEGAQDYLIKGELDPRLLSRALRYAIERHRMQVALQSESVIDELTKLYNRKGFLALADNHLRLAERTRQPLSLAFIDLDGMKQINDTLGHLAGDRALVETAGLLTRCIRRSDILARFGGDEFVMLLTSVGPDAQAAIERRVQLQLDTCNAQPDRLYRLALSVGIVTVNFSDRPTLEALLRQADTLMYKEKKRKKSTA